MSSPFFSNAKIEGFRKTGANTPGHAPSLACVGENYLAFPKLLYPELRRYQLNFMLPFKCNLWDYLSLQPDSAVP